MSSDSRNVPTDARDQAVQICEAWRNIDSTTSYGPLTLEQLEAQIAAADEADKMVTRLEDQLAAARDEYWAKRRQMWDSVKQMRLWAKATHGADSQQYERFGGTRASDFKRRRPASKTPSPALVAGGDD